MRRMDAVCGSLIVILFAAAAALPGQKLALQKVRVVSIPARPLPVSVAIMHGTFAKYGLEVQDEVAPSSDKLRGMIAADDADIAHVSVDNAVAMVDTGAADVVIVLGGESTLNELIAQPDIHSIADLRGKTISVDATNTAYALQLRKMLRSVGLEAGRDYSMKPIGASPLRLKALHENKQYAATVLGPPASLAAKNDGFVSLGPVEKFVGRSQSASAFVKRKWAQSHSDILVRYLAAYVEEQRWLLDTANKQQVVELLQKEFKLPASVAAEMYAGSMQGNAGYQKDARFELDGFKNVLKLRAEIEGPPGGKAPAPEKYYDMSYYRKALVKLKSQAK
jgi:ABC-type nitrate/sulfonate/bicarbonate transport system substrate-binding protein